MKSCAAQTAFNTVIPAAPVVGSPDDLLNRFVGQVVTKSVTLNDGAGAKFKSLFTINGAVEIKTLYGIFTDVTNVVTVSTCYFDIYDGAVASDLTASGTDCSTATVNSAIVVRANALAALTFLKSDQVRFSQMTTASVRQYQRALINSKNGVATTVRFAVTEDAATNCAITFYCTWSAVTPGSTLVAA